MKIGGEMLDKTEEVDWNQTIQSWSIFKAMIKYFILSILETTEWFSTVKRYVWFKLHEDHWEYFTDNWEDHMLIKCLGNNIFT